MHTNLRQTRQPDLELLTAMTITRKHWDSSNLHQWPRYTSGRNSRRK